MKRMMLAATLAVVALSVVVQPAAAGHTRFSVSGAQRDGTEPAATFDLRKRSVLTLWMVTDSEDGSPCSTTFVVKRHTNPGNDRFEKHLTPDDGSYSVSGQRMRRGLHDVFVQSTCSSWTIIGIRTGTW